MSRLDRRQVLLALAALGASAATPAGALPQIDPEGARRIGKAYLADRKATIDPKRLQAELLPDGWSPQATARLRERVAADFRQGRLFVYRGWRMSDTEGRLFALTVLS